MLSLFCKLSFSALLNESYRLGIKKLTQQKLVTYMWFNRGRTVYISLKLVIVPKILERRKINEKLKYEQLLG
jgi:hypothetical protein